MTSNHETMIDQGRLGEAVRQAWCSETSGDPAEWTAANPAKGHCDVSSFVAWEHLGGELVLGRVLIDGCQTEHHYWNRIDGEDVDLTREQFTGNEEIEEIGVLASDDIKARRDTMRPELKARIDSFRPRVNALLRGDALGP